MSKAEHSEAQGWFLRCWSTAACWWCSQCFPLLKVRVGSATVAVQCHLCSRWRCNNSPKCMVFIRKWFICQVVKSCTYFRVVHKSSIDKGSADCAHKKKNQTTNQKLIPSKQGRKAERSWLSYTLLFWQPNPAPVPLFLPFAGWITDFPFVWQGAERWEHVQIPGGDRVRDGGERAFPCARLHLWQRILRRWDYPNVSLEQTEKSGHISECETRKELMTSDVSLR